MPKPAPFVPHSAKVKLAALVGADYNPRKIVQKDLDKLADSLRKFGTLQPITVNQRTGRVVGGHQRLKAYAQLGLDTVDVWYVSLSDVEEKTANLALNNMAGTWDDDPLKALLLELKDEGMNLDFTGFHSTELNDFLKDIPEIDFDAIDKLAGDSPASSSAPVTPTTSTANVGEGEAQEEVKSTKTYMITAVVGQEDYLLWERMKKQVGLTTDRAMIQRLIQPLPTAKP
jgi:hypothetical protein